MNYVDWDNQDPEEGKDGVMSMSKEEFQEYQNRVSSRLATRTMGKDYESYLNDEGEDVRDLAERAEAQRDGLREAEWEAKVEQWMEKHPNGIWLKNN